MKEFVCLCWRSSGGRETPRNSSPRSTRSLSIRWLATGRIVECISVLGGDDGLVIVDLWDSEEDFRAMTDDPQFQRNLQDAGTPKPDVLEIFEVHATIP